MRRADVFSYYFLFLCRTNGHLKLFFVWSFRQRYFPVVHLDGMTPFSLNAPGTRKDVGAALLSHFAVQVRLAVRICLAG